MPSPVGFAAVLRSWEDRFGARLLRQPIRQTAKDLARNPLWYFWWD